MDRKDNLVEDAFTIAQLIRQIDTMDGTYDPKIYTHLCHAKWRLLKAADLMCPLLQQKPPTATCTKI